MLKYWNLLSCRFVFVRFDCPKSVCYAFKIFPDLDLQLAKDKKKCKVQTDRKYQNEVSSERGYSCNKERFVFLKLFLSAHLHYYYLF